MSESFEFANISENKVFAYISESTVDNFACFSNIYTYRCLPFNELLSSNSLHLLMKRFARVKCIV